MYLRPYQSGDLDALFALDQVCFAPRFRFSRTVMRQVVQAANAIVRLACERDSAEQEHLLGFCAVDLHRQEQQVLGYLATLDVDPAARRRGVGRQLVTALEDLVAAEGGRWMWLHVYTRNPAAIRLYEALGYVRGKRVGGFYGVGADAWTYRKQLG